MAIDSDDETWLSRSLERFVPRVWRDDEAEPELGRKARALVIVTGIAAVLSVISGLQHLVGGNYMLAVILEFTVIPVFASIWILHRTLRIDLATHWLCAYATLNTLVSAWLFGAVFPVYASLTVVPVAATTIAGARVGFFWSVSTVGVLIVTALAVAQTPADDVMGWNAVVAAAVVGSAIVTSEAAREHADRRSKLAWEAANKDQQIRSKTERELAESQNLFETAFARAPSILVLSVLDGGELLDVNERFVQLLGYARDEVIGKDLVELGVWGGRENRERIMSMVAEGTLREAEIPLRKRNGEELWLLSSAEHIEIDGRRCLLCQGVDITERKRSMEQFKAQRYELESQYAERGEQLEASRVQLRESERLAAVGTLAAGVAHQINNPIGGIAAASEFALMLDSEDDREAVRTEALEIALEEARRCGRIVKSMLKFARDEPTPKWVENINTTVYRAAELSRSYVEGMGGKLDLEIWPGDLPCMISPIDIEQVIVNLVRNAAESRTGGAEVKVVTDRSEDEVEISIIDNGAGIEPETRKQMYDPFYTTRLEQGGSGLGLSVVHGVIRDHGGSLEIESCEPEGTRFRIRLRIAAPPVV